MASKMDLARMLEKCRREQWTVADIDLSKSPESMSRDKEIAIVQYFTDMAGIERLAGALFYEQGRKTDDPNLRQIFDSFVKDEIRHSHVAQMLADHYDVHRYRPYQPNKHLLRFTPHFVNAIRYLTPEIANAYITTGELILDIALLRSLADYVDDETVRGAMELIDRDESRHIAIDFHMVGHYSSDAYEAEEKKRPRPGLTERAKATWAFSSMLFHARPFFRDVFFGPMDVVDPSGKRLLEAFKRVQLVATKPRVRKRPFVRFMTTMQDIYRQPAGKLLFGRLLLRVIGTQPRVVERLYADEEEHRAQAMSFDELAEEALAVKRAG